MQILRNEIKQRSNNGMKKDKVNTATSTKLTRTTAANISKK